MHYQNNYLSKVVLRIDFDPILALQSNVQVDVRPEFSERIAGVFSHVIGRPITSFRFNMAPGASGVTEQIMAIEWLHRKTENGTIVVVLGPTFLAIEYGKDDYLHFPSFRAEIESVLMAFHASYQLPVFNRIGLRYINEISLAEGNPLDWDNLIAPDLITAVKACTLEDMSMVRSMHQLHVRQNESTLIFNYGLANPDFPNNLARRVFVLDYDCSQTGVLPNAALDSISQLNSLSESMFEASIAPGLRTIMGVIPQ
jgi:uncharacterized protein (TIGR04255 family)